MGRLLPWQLDVAADAAAAGVLRAAVRRLHDAGAAAGHDRKAGLGEPPAHLARERVVGMVLGEARRAEDRDAGADEVQRAEAAEELDEDAQRAPELRAAPPRSGEQPPLLLVRRPLPPVRHASPLLRAPVHRSEWPPGRRSRVARGCAAVCRLLEIRLVTHAHPPHGADLGEGTRANRPVRQPASCSCGRSSAVCRPLSSVARLTASSRRMYHAVTY